MLRKLRKIKRKVLPYIVAYGGKWYVRAALLTCKVELDGMESFVQAAQSKQCILALWHNRIFLIAEFLRKHASHFSYAAFVSKSNDAEAVAILAESYPFGRALLVPHNARHQALRNAIKVMKEKREILLITPDGPRGPRYQVKQGVIIAAKESGACIIPFSWSANRYWELNSWDKMRIPKPFSKIKVVVGIPMEVSKESCTNEGTKKLEAALDQCGK